MTPVIDDLVQWFGTGTRFDGGAFDRGCQVGPGGDLDPDNPLVISLDQVCHAGTAVWTPGNGSGIAFTLDDWGQRPWIVDESSAGLNVVLIGDADALSDNVCQPLQDTDTAQFARRLLTTTCGVAEQECIENDSWVATNTFGPSPRWGDAVTSDFHRGTVVLFGGQDGGGYKQDTWEYDGVEWLERGPALSPNSRAGHKLAYDRDHARTVLFGGWNGTSYLNDTWTYDGTTWTPAGGSGGPSGRRGHAMAYDLARQKTILFGGYDGAALNDTWAWDGASWQQTPPQPDGPPVLHDVAMAYDEARQRIVLYDGLGEGHTWEWDGTTWAQADTVEGAPNPGIRTGFTMAYERSCQAVMLYGGDGPGADDHPWMWDGRVWRSLRSGPGNRVMAGLAWNLPRSRMLLHGGYSVDTNHLLGDTWAWCSPCSDEQAPLDSSGMVVFPANLDQPEPPEEEISTFTGDVDDLYPGYDTSIGTWPSDYPCPWSFGGTPPTQATIDSLLPETFMDVPRGEVMDSLSAWDSLATAKFGFEPDSLDYFSPNDSVSFQPGPPHQPDSSGCYVFGGRDIVYVHGLYTGPIWDKMCRPLWFAEEYGAWKHPEAHPGGGPGENFEFYHGRWHRNANWYWEDHIQRFLTDKGMRNRYLVVSWPVTEGLDTAVEAVLAQIGDAMRFGTGVVDSCGHDPLGFGLPGFVIVSHSTGGLLADVAMAAAANQPSLHSQFIADRCKAHVALNAAAEGSRYATPVVGLALLNQTHPTWASWIGALVDTTMAFLGHQGVAPGQCGFSLENALAGPTFSPAVLSSVLVDLVPGVTQARWGSYLNRTPMPTVSVVGGHPSAFFPLKTLLQPGFDDGVITVNSQAANPDWTVFWPTLYLAKPPAMIRTFDMGLATSGQPRRAVFYYLDQDVEARLFHPVLARLGAVCAPVIPHVSPSGMVQPVWSDMGDTPYSSLNRHEKHFSYLQAAADHGAAVADEPGYQDTFGETNAEETLVVSDDGIYDAYDIAAGGDYAPLLDRGRRLSEVETVRGLKVGPFCIKVFKRRFCSKTWWIWKRVYHRIERWERKLACDYAYETILRRVGVQQDSCPPCEMPPTSSVGQSPWVTMGRWPSVQCVNPFPRGGAIRVAIPRSSQIRLMVMDVAGREVKTLVSGMLEAGIHELAWDGTDDRANRLPRGVYFLRLNGEGQKSAKKIVLLR